MEHHAVLRREFERIADITNEAYEKMTEAQSKDMPSKLLEASYKDWASLLLRYHDAIERISKDEGDQRSALPSMKDSA